MGRQVKIIDPLGNAVSMEYDGNGNVVAKTDSRGFTTTFVYDAANRLIQENTPCDKDDSICTITKLYEYYNDGKKKKETLKISDENHENVVTGVEMIKISINCISRNRSLGKALRRVRPRLDEIFEEIKRSDLQEDIYNDIIIWISDNPINYYNEIKNKYEFSEFYIGFNQSLSLNPKDDDILYSHLIERLEFFIKNCPFRNETRSKLLMILSKYRC